VGLLQLNIPTPTTKPITLERSFSTRQANKVIRRLVSHLILLVGCVVMAMPFIWMFLSSLKTDMEIFVFPPRLLPETVHWDNYLAVMESMPFGWFIFNSFKISLLAMIGQLLSCSLAAYAFARIKFPGRETVFVIWLACLMIPYQVNLIPQYVLFRSFGWLDTHFPLIVPNFFGGVFGTFLLRQFFLTLPSELEDAARIDGCSRFGIYWRIFLPLSKPALATLGVFVFMSNWNNLLGPVVYLSSYEKMTLTVGLAFFRGQYTTEWALLMAGAVISVIPIMVIYAAAQQYFVQGVVMSGIKG
jgi:multiple sugar transport system permease protein